MSRCSFFISRTDSAFPMGVPSFNRLVDVPPLFVLMCYQGCLV